MNARKGVVAIIAGTGGGQLIALLASPLIFRLFTPAEFGVFTTISSIAMILGAVAAWKFDGAVPLPAHDEDARALVGFGLAASIMTVLIGLAVVLIGRNYIDVVWPTAPNDFIRWLWLAPVVAGMIGAVLVLNQWAIRNRRFSAIARRNLMNSTVTVLVQIGAGVVKLQTVGLLLGLLLGQTAALISLLWRSKLGTSRHLASQLMSSREVARRYSRFPRVLVPAGLLNALGGYMAPLLLIGLYGAQEAGWYGLTQRMIAIPVALIGYSVAQVYLGELAQSRREQRGREARTFWIVTKRLSALAVIGGAMVFFLGPWVFQVVFGDAWDTSGHMARAMSILLMAQMVAGPVSQTLIAFEKTGLQLLWDASRLVVVSSAMVGTALSGASVLTAVWAFSIASAGMYAISWDISRRLVSSPPES